jgi:hypothetical protein
MQLINQNNSFLNDRGFKSLHCHGWNDRKLRKRRDNSVTNEIHDGGFRLLIVALCARAFIDRRLFGLRKPVPCVRIQQESLTDLEYFVHRLAPVLWDMAGLCRLNGDYALRRCRQPAKGFPATIGLTTGGTA